MSDGDIPIKIELFGVATLEGIIIRYLAPLTADPILDKMPFVLRGRWSFGSKKYWTLPGTKIRAGTNPKSTTEVEKGDIVFNPKTDEFIIVLEDMEMPNKINKIGRITSLNLDSMLNANNGLNTKVHKV
ncbi:MAG: cyclophilin-like fold protein [Candidatus Lokiarchaeota archaeon]